MRYFFVKSFDDVELVPNFPIEVYRKDLGTNSCFCLQYCG